ncbi:MAG: hypothetical protein R2779_04205 [Crocinitomicaceae bacterium]
MEIIDLLSKGLIIEPSSNVMYKPGDYIQGLASDLISTVKDYADPLVTKIQDVATSVDKFIVSFQSFWDTT